MTQTAMRGPSSNGRMGDIVSGSVLSGVVAAVATLAWLAWPGDPGLAAPEAPLSRSRTDEAPGVGQAPQVVRLEFVVESEDQAQSLRNAGMIPPSTVRTMLPISVAVVKLGPADLQARDQHLAAVCASTTCSPAVYIDLRRVLPD